jgi:hypothetical protein
MGACTKVNGNAEGCTGDGEAWVRRDRLNVGVRGSCSFQRQCGKNLDCVSGSSKGEDVAGRMRKQRRCLV